MVLRLNQPLSEDHPFYGGRIIFGVKKPVPSARSATGSEPEQVQNNESGKNKPVAPSDSDGNT